MLNIMTGAFCKWDIPALIVLLLIAAVFIVHMVRYKKRQNSLEQQLNQQLEDNSSK
ncbi:hypothetical protein [Anaerolentibacter hominis]|uniref:hypothetical protein n=1 Tax=Anaerolentibacter hominis TaxID=3079009 RepID=UPI0031B867F4